MLTDLRRERQLKKLLQKLGLVALESVNFSLLDLALTHPSFSQTANYQQLEFVGDAVIRLAAAQILWEKFPDVSVGEFAAIRSILVSDRFLAELAESYGLENYLLITQNVLADPNSKTSRLADAFEAILGALYLSTHNLELICPWLTPILAEKAMEVYQEPARYNYKDALQTWTQAQYQILPEYRVQENRQLQQESDRFLAEVWLHNKCLGKGKGKSKKAAEKAAAKQAFTEVNN